MENCSFYYAGECRRRLGFGGKVSLGKIGWSGVELGSYALVGTSAGDILSVTQSTSAVASLASGLTATAYPTFAVMNGRAYYANGTEVRVCDTGATAARTVGIAAPASAATASGTSSGGVVDVGEHLVRYRYYDSSRNRLSNPSTAASVTTTAGQKVAVGYAASADSTVNYIIIEMTAVGASTYYRAATIANSGSSYTLDISDDNLIVGVAASRDGEWQHGTPPAYDIISEHRQRLWLWEASNGELAWSRALFPESWDSVNYSRKITLDNGDTPSGLASFYTDLYLIGQRSMRRLVYTSDPSAAMVVDVPGNFGVFNQRCLIKIDGGILLGWGKNGAWIIDAMQPKKISANIDDTLASLASATTTARFVTYEPTRREVLFFFPLSGETYCKAAFCYSLDTKEWTLYKFRQPISCAVLNSQYTDRERLMICDSNTYGWRMGVSANDGGGDGVITVSTGSTTTIIQATNTAVVGQTLYNPTTTEERLITACDSSSITVGVAFAAAPTSGTVMYVGSIRQKLVTDWWPGQSMVAKKRPTKFQIAVRSEGDMGTGTVSYYQDFSGTAVSATSFASDAFPEGVSISSGAITVNFDTGAADGYVSVPMPADWKRVIATQIIIETPYDGVRLVEAAIKDDSTMQEDGE
jgi:hypothetical protein